MGGSTGGARGDGSLDVESLRRGLSPLLTTGGAGDGRLEYNTTDDESEWGGEVGSPFVSDSRAVAAKSYLGTQKYLSIDSKDFTYFMCYAILKSL